MKIIAVIVTYNRLALLKQCIRSVKEQARKPEMIIVINNGSTDETQQWLAEQSIITYHQENSGGAGGFSSGINIAYSHGADWIWLMDDDTIPNSNALQKLLLTLDQLQHQKEKIGFLASTVFWTDGNIHEMNRTYQLRDKEILDRLSFDNKTDMPLIQFGTFVSMLLSSRAVEKVGLPIREYFIWNDDVEYSKRIIGRGLAGIAVKDSVVIHATPTNHQSNVFLDPESSIWKFKYGLRNELNTKRLHEGQFSFWLSWIHRMFIMPFRIILKRNSHQWSFIKVVWQTSLKSLTFSPPIVKADQRTTLQKSQISE